MNIINQKFGKLTVIKFLGKQIYLCICDCENKNYKNVRKTYLTSGRVKSCGCILEGKKLKFNIGDTHELLTITELFYDSAHLYCKCDCKCGNSTTILGSDFKKVKSCGCLRNKHKARTTDLCNKKFGMLTVLSFAYFR